VFGLSFGELLVLLLVSVVVLGPKELPRYLRKAGQFAGKMRRLAFEMRQKSGIDEVLRTEGIDRDIAEIRQLARGELGGVMAVARSTVDAARLHPNGTAPTATVAASSTALGGASGAAPHPGLPVQAAPIDSIAYPTVAVEREYPAEGADAYGALPDGAAVYDGAFPASPLAEDALYTRGVDVTDATDTAPMEPAEPTSAPDAAAAAASAEAPGTTA
jgi:sec-independent protein translocase protein TatB